jgi:hypothetical protein
LCKSTTPAALQAVKQQIGQPLGGMSVFSAQRDVIQADPEGQQYGHYSKHSVIVGATA